MKRRKRSHLSEADTIAAIKPFARRLLRFKESTENFDGIRPDANPNTERGTICIVLKVTGGFGVAEDFFEALRVLGDFKLPRNTPLTRADRIARRDRRRLQRALEARP